MCHTGCHMPLWGYCHHWQWQRCPKQPLTCAQQETASILHSMEKTPWNPQLVDRYKAALKLLTVEESCCSNLWKRISFIQPYEFGENKCNKKLYFSFPNWTQYLKECLASPTNHCLGFKLEKLHKQIFTSYSLSPQIKFELKIPFLTNFHSSLIKRKLN